MFERFPCMKAFSAVSAIASVVAQVVATGVVEFTKETEVNQVLQEHEYTIISFYDSDEHSVSVEAVFGGAKAYMDEKIQNGDWAHRDIGWYRCDIEKFPEQAPEENELIADQMMYVRIDGTYRYLHFDPSYENLEDNEEHLALMVRELSGEWFEEIDCDEIQHESRFFYDELVYFGDAEADIKWDNELNYLLHASVYDRYTFDQHRIGFYYNKDPECAKSHDLDPDEKQIVIYNGDNAIPVHIPIKDETTIHAITYHINNAICLGTPRWSQRSYETVFKYWKNALVFMLDEGSLYNVVNHKDDWRIALMAKITEWIQENDTTFIPVIGHWDLEDEETLRVPSLVEILGISKDDIPHLYLYHPINHQVVAYPEKLDDIKKFSPEVVMAWAEKIVLQWQIDDIDQQMEYKYTNDEGEEVFAVPEEQKEDFRALKRDYEWLMAKKEKEHDQMIAELEKENHFHLNLEDHFEVAESHMTRIEQAFMEEL